MSETSRLWDSSRPWFHLVAGAVNADVLREPKSADAKLVEMDAARMGGVDEVFGEFVREFAFPEYFGWNWPAFAECMIDLSWFPARGYLLLIKQPELLLSDNLADRATFLRIMHETCSMWARSFALGPEFGGGEVPFNIVFLYGGRVGVELRKEIGSYL